jgi:hypothetical protein
MTQAETQKELAAMDANIALAELEVAKAEERVQQIAYDKARFLLELQTEFVKRQVEAVKSKEETKDAI